MRTFARFVVRHPRLVVFTWVVVFVVALIPAGKLEDRVANSGYDVPGSQSKAVTDLVAENFEHGDREVLYAVVRGPDASKQVRQLAAHLREETAFASARVFPPRAGPNLAILPFTIPGEIGDLQKRIPALEDSLHRVDSEAKLLGRPAVWHESTSISQEDLARAETLALPLTLLVLIVAFLSVIAASVPIGLAIVLLLVTFGALSTLAVVIDTSVYVTNTASILGLALAIDYSLFIVTRYRELRDENGGDIEAAIYRTLETTGYAILFSGVTIALALSSLAAMGLGVFTSMAVGASVAAAISCLGALTLVPAILRLLGDRIDMLRLRPAARAAASGRVWHALARGVLRRPVVVVVTTIVVLVLCAIPLRSAHLTFASTDISLPPGNELRAVNDAAERALGPGALNPIEVVTDAPPRQVAGQLRAMPEIASVAPPRPGERGWYRIVALPTVPSNTPAADRLVRDLREELSAPAGNRLYVGGETAQSIDLIDRIEARIFWMVAIACALAFLLLAIAFRSIVIPLKAIVTNLLSVAATLGLVSLLFEGLGNSDGIAWFVPPFLFAIVFGLSMDYEIFLLSRVREEHLAGASDDEAITRALVRNARPITLAATVMVIVFLALALSRLEMFQQLGVGMAIAVLLDATIVRCGLVPATVKLLGYRNWWFPRGLAKFLPTIWAPETSDSKMAAGETRS